MRKIDTIVVHCTATRPEWWASKSAEEKVREVRDWHVSGRGWSDIGYHYLIDRDGTVVRGRPIERAGAHAKGHNATSIGISLFGGHGSTRNDDFSDNFTAEQESALRALIQELEAKYPIHKIIGHNDVSAKACPGFQVGPWLKHHPVRTNPVQSKTVQASAAQLATAAGGGLGALAALDGTAQLVALGLVGAVALLAIWIMRERLKAWAAGWR
jgi:N-acetylmuramoyl-L-alanine amidase